VAIGDEAKFGVRIGGCRVGPPGRRTVIIEKSVESIWKIAGWTAESTEVYESVVMVMRPPVFLRQKARCRNHHEQRACDEHLYGCFVHDDLRRFARETASNT
jgi:hypothetical protein